MADQRTDAGNCYVSEEFETIIFLFFEVFWCKDGVIVFVFQEWRLPIVFIMVDFILRIIESRGGHQKRVATY